MIPELQYLADLSKKYDAHYFKRYFGFTLIDICNKMGVEKSYLAQVLKRERKLHPQHEADFIRIFNDMDIRKKTENFKETPGQLSRKSLNKNLRFFLTLFSLCATLSFMENNFQQYITSHRRIGQLLNNNLKAIVVSISTVAFLFFNRRTTKNRFLDKAVFSF